MSVYDELMKCCIQRQDIPMQKHFFLADNLPSDFAALLDVQPPRHGAIFTAEKNTTRGWARSKNTKYLPIAKELDDLVQPLLQRLHGSYSDCVLQNVMLDSDKKTLIVNVKGSGSRYCQLIKQVHRSNRVFFMIYLKTGYMHVKCFDQICKKRREELMPSKKRKLVTAVKDPDANYLCNQISTRLPDNIWEQLCVSVNIPYRNNSYMAKPKIQISPATNVTLMTTNPDRIRQEQQHQKQITEKMAKRSRGKEECNAPETVTTDPNVNLMDFAGDSGLSSLLAGFK